MLLNLRLLLFAIMTNRYWIITAKSSCNWYEIEGFLMPGHILKPNSGIQLVETGFNNEAAMNSKKYFFIYEAT